MYKRLGYHIIVSTWQLAVLVCFCLSANYIKLYLQIIISKQFFISSSYCVLSRYYEIHKDKAQYNKRITNIHDHHSITLILSCYCSTTTV